MADHSAEAEASGGRAGPRELEDHSAAAEEFAVPADRRARADRSAGAEGSGAQAGLNELEDHSVAVEAFDARAGLPEQADRYAAAEDRYAEAAALAALAGHCHGLGPAGQGQALTAAPMPPLDTYSSTSSLVLSP